LLTANPDGEIREKYTVKVSRTYRIEQETADRIAEISEAEKKTATEVIESAIRTYSTEKYVENTARQTDSTDSRALSALIGQLAKKDEQIAKLMDTVADSTKAVQGAQALHHETAQTLALESTEQKLSRWQRLKRAWRG
jgi:predicted transcriptional regulator